MSSWFKNWFDSPYYHILYKNRNYEEAEFFMQKLIYFLDLKPQTKILDLACGKGRHAIFLNKQHLDVVGIDLSKESILEAQKFENKYLNFFVQDMRLPFRINYFDCIFNLFTSFGYFEKNEDNNKVLKAVNKGLKKNGLFVLDFFNAEYIKSTLVTSETKTVDGIEFKIDKEVKNNCIVKKIQFAINGENKMFLEKVTLFTKNDLDKLLIENNFEITNYFGDYSLNNFDTIKSSRLIIIARKK